MINRDEPTYENQLWHAERYYQEKGAFALNNPHGMTGKICKCGECFCCAANEVLIRHKDQLRIFRHGQG